MAELIYKEESYAIMDAYSTLFVPFRVFRGFTFASLSVESKHE